MPSSLWTPQEGTQAYRLRCAGQSCQQIALALGRPRGSVSSLFTRLRRAGIAIPPSPLNGSHTPTPIDMDHARQLREAGWSYPRIAQEMGVSVSIIWRRLKFEQEGRMSGLEAADG